MPIGQLLILFKSTRSAPFIPRPSPFVGLRCAPASSRTGPGGMGAAAPLGRKVSWVANYRFCPGLLHPRHNKGSVVNAVRVLFDKDKRSIGLPDLRKIGHYLETLAPSECPNTHIPVHGVTTNACLASNRAEIVGTAVNLHCFAVAIEPCLRNQGEICVVGV